MRTEQGEIVVEKKGYTSYTKKNKILGLPIIRGFISLIESLIIGVQTLNYSASFLKRRENLLKLDKWIQKIFKEKSNDVIMGISLIISLSYICRVIFYFTNICG